MSVTELSAKIILPLRFFMLLACDEGVLADAAPPFIGYINNENSSS
jgi:hypothetical protein